MQATNFIIRHVKFQQNKMNVKLAAQTMSASVTAALKYAFQFGCRGFDSCLGTANFVTIIDHLFDIFNSRTLLVNGYKSPLRRENYRSVESFY